MTLFVYNFTIRFMIHNNKLKKMPANIVTITCRNHRFFIHETYFLAAVLGVFLYAVFNDDLVGTGN